MLVHTLKHKITNPWVGCPFLNCPVLALFLCPILSYWACISVNDSHLSTFSDSTISFNMGTSSIPDWVLGVPGHCALGPTSSTARCCGSSHHSFIHSFKPAALHKVGVQVCQEPLTSLSAVVVCPLSSSHYFDAALRSQMEVVCSSVYCKVHSDLLKGFQINTVLKCWWVQMVLVSDKIWLHFSSWNKNSQNYLFHNNQLALLWLPILFMPERCSRCTHEGI